MDKGLSGKLSCMPIGIVFLVVNSPFKFQEYSTYMEDPIVSPIALRMAKTLWSFGHSECNRVKKRWVKRVVNLLRVE